MELLFWTHSNVYPGFRSQAFACHLRVVCVFHHKYFWLVYQVNEYHFTKLRNSQKKEYCYLHLQALVESSRKLYTAHLISSSSPTNAYTCGSMWIKETLLQYWLSRGKQVSHQRWAWGIHCMKMTRHASEGSILTWNPGQTPPEVQTKSISGPTKITKVLKNQKIYLCYSKTSRPWQI